MSQPCPLGDPEASPTSITSTTQGMYLLALLAFLRQYFLIVSPSMLVDAQLRGVLIGPLAGMT